MGMPPAKWIKLAAPSVSLNGPNVVNLCPMSHTFVIPYGTTNEDMIKKVPKGVKHLVFNCHGLPAKPDYPAHLVIGQTLKLDNVSVCRPLFDIASLRCIWLAACNIGGTGLPFCKELARTTGCFVITQETAVPDRKMQNHCVEDYDYAMPKYIDPFGDMVVKAKFFELGERLGFKKL